MGEDEGADVERGEGDRGGRTAPAEPQDTRGDAGCGEHSATEGPDAGALRDAEAGGQPDGHEDGGGKPSANEGRGRHALESSSPERARAPDGERPGPSRLSQLLIIVEWLADTPSAAAIHR